MEVQAAGGILTRSVKQGRTVQQLGLPGIMGRDEVPAYPKVRDSLPRVVYHDHPTHDALGHPILVDVEIPDAVELTLAPSSLHEAFAFGLRKWPGEIDVLLKPWTQHLARHVLNLIHERTTQSVTPDEWLEALDRVTGTDEWKRICSAREAAISAIETCDWATCARALHAFSNRYSSAITPNGHD